MIGNELPTFNSNRIQLRESLIKDLETVTQAILHMQNKPGIRSFNQQISNKNI